MKKLLLLIINSVFLILNSHAQWSTNPAVNNAIVIAPLEQSFPEIISDGAGGAIITWQGIINVSGTDWNIYAQRIDANGVVLWTTNGIAICTESAEQRHPKIISDGDGGAIIIWLDLRNNYLSVYGQRINGNGIAQWTTNGVPIYIGGPGTLNDKHLLVSDGLNGAIIIGARGGNIYAHHINANGIVQWGSNGVVICNSAIALLPKVCSDNAGGAIVTWYDGNSYDVYAQRINSNGLVQWTVNGVALCTATNQQLEQQIVSDGIGGAIIVWQDRRSGSRWDIYAQRINLNGNVQWTSDGVLICMITDDYSVRRIQVTSDDAEGAIITWQDNRHATTVPLVSNYDIFAQRINLDGIVQWTADGVPICNLTGNQEYPQLLSDGAGGAIITWCSPVKSQRLNANGLVQWTANGEAICTITQSQLYPQLISDGSEGAIITWQDGRHSNFDIYAQNICATGTIGTCLVTSIPDNFISGIHSWISNNQLYVVFNSDNTNIVGEQRIALNLFDLSGRLLQSDIHVNAQSTTYKMNISDLAQGIYLVSLQSENYIYSNKIIVNR